MEANDKFKRFLEMTDHPERFSDEELMQLARDPEMAAWYEALANAEAAAKEMTAMPKLRSRKVASIVGWTMATAAMLTAALLLWPKNHETIMMQPEQQPPFITEVMPSDNISPETVEEEAPVGQTQTIPASHAKKPQTKKPIAQAVATVKKKEEARPLTVETVPVTQELERSARDVMHSPKSPFPADKQALADLYLAEMVLQVAYEQQAVQQQVRAYALSLSGSEAEEAQPIIAF